MVTSFVAVFENIGKMFHLNFRAKNNIFFISTEAFLANADFWREN